LRLAISLTASSNVPVGFDAAFLPRCLMMSASSFSVRNRIWLKTGYVVSEPAQISLMSAAGMSFDFGITSCILFSKPIKILARSNDVFAANDRKHGVSIPFLIYHRYV
jgi:hypothetical protein